MAVATPHLARQLVLDALLRWIVPLQIMMTVCEVDVLLVEDGRPLERRGVLRLAGRAVAQLGVEGLFAAELVFYLAAVAFGFVAGIELIVGLVDAVGRALLPLAESGRGLTAGLILVHGDGEVGGRTVTGEKGGNR